MTPNQQLLVSRIMTPNQQLFGLGNDPKPAVPWLSTNPKPAAPCPGAVSFPASPAPGPRCPQCPCGVPGRGLMCGFCSPGNKTEKSIPVKAQGPSSVQLADLTPGMMYKLWVFPIWSHPSEHSYITFTTSSGETGVGRVSPECPRRVPSMAPAWSSHPMVLWPWLHGNPSSHLPQLIAFLNLGVTRCCTEEENPRKGW